MLRKYVLQRDTTDCGPACIASLLKHYNQNYSISEIRDICKCGIDGTTAYGITKALQYYGFNGIAYKVNKLDDIKSYPCIVHILKNNDPHFVMLLKVDKKVIYFDPGIGVLKEDYSDFCEKWTNVLIECKPNSKFTSSIKVTRLRNYIIELVNFKKIIPIFISSLLIIIIGIITNYFYKYLIDTILVKQRNYYLYLGLVFYSLTVVTSALFTYIRNLLILKYSNLIQKKVFRKFIINILNIDISFFLRRSKAEIVTRYNDISEINQLFVDISSLFIDSLLMIIASIFILIYSLKIFVILIIATVMYLFLNLIYFYKIKFHNYSVFMSNIDLNNQFLNVYENITTINNYNLKNKFLLRFSKALNVQINATYDKSISLFNYQLISQSIYYISQIIIFLVGSKMVFNNQITPGDLIMYNTISIFYLTPMQKLIFTQTSIVTSIISLKRLAELSNYQTEVKSNNYKIDEIRKIEFENVYFSYDYNTDIISQLTVILRKDKRNVIIGDNGVGKSTLVKLILNQFKPDSGIVKINNIDINSIDIKNYLNKISYISDDIKLFNDSIINNIVLFKEVNFQKLNKIYSSLNFEDKLIERINNNEIVKEFGNNLSSGERQKILLARALYKEVSLLILDEPFIFLDEKSLGDLKNLLSNLVNELMIIIVTHNRGIINEEDNVILLKKRGM